MKNRQEIKNIKERAASTLGRIIVLTGARQTGKTTVAKQCFPAYSYISLDDPVQRGDYLSLNARQWQELFPNAILDEVQKTPALIESVKSVYDYFAEPRYLLLGSSQFLLLEKVRESLAGRCVILEMYPLTLPEMQTSSFEETVNQSFFVKYMQNKAELNNLLPTFSLDKRFAQKRRVFDFALQFGGYPALTNEILSDDERREWLRNYVITFLERDIRDLAAFRDLEPFVKLQHYLANITAGMVNFSSIAKETGVSVPTVQRYVRYMELSYQVLLLPAWFANPLKKLVKSPKVHFMDTGVLRSVLQKQGKLSGDEFESFVVAEIYKQIKNSHLPLKCYYLRTLDGREVDLIIEAEDGFTAIEVKVTENTDKSDAKNLLDLQEILNKPLKHSFILSNDNKTKFFGENITAMHAAAFLCS
ncbi:MAG: ATP-binding protein [Prevotellaceae bacterium]|jgi:predicted AAA+ superfamily ATPase|nr:ATP-binding protein [Prevotellaceae bacterium]